MWTNKLIRESYLGFFENKGHRRLPSAPLIPVNDPTLLIIGAGMAPFKPEFSGLVKPVFPRITTCQKCVRADDIEYVGKTSRHHTFFEMLGNFSFGDYFKEEAIVWAWELVTQVYKLPIEKLWISIHPEDDEAYEIWTTKAGVKAGKIIRITENFWGPIGTSGPCGPCSEILLDRGIEWGCGKPSCKAGCDCDRYLEFWNLVFTMYHKDLTKNIIKELPNKNIDTGMGLERMTMILQDKPSPFETDLFAPLMSLLSGKCKSNESQAMASKQAMISKQAIASRIVADHIRAATFMAVDTITPSNEGRGYVMRQLIRRAMRHAKSIGVESLAPLVSTVCAIMGDIYPELNTRKEYAFRVIQEEERNFSEALDRAAPLVDKLFETKKAKGEKTISGEEAAEFYDTYGFPLEAITELAKEKGFDVDQLGFKEAMECRSKRARNAAINTKTNDVLFLAEDAFNNLGMETPTKFKGYEEGSINNTSVLGLWKFDKQKQLIQVEELCQGEEGVVLLDQTPFYAEGGGPLGDKGYIYGNKGKIEIYNTKSTDLYEKGGKLYFHFGIVTQGSIQLTNIVTAEVDAIFREGIKRHHTATHLLHTALRQILGEHVAQAGSLVAPDRLRFDFSHFSALTPNEIRKIEILVNQKIREGLAIKIHETSMDEAKQLGAIAFFDEKYGDRVRVVQVSDFSFELCGGIHVKNTAEIGMFKIISEEAIGQGLRRIEAKVALALEEYVIEQEEILATLGDILRSSSKDLPTTVEQVVLKTKEQERQIKELEQKLAGREAELLFTKVDEHAGIKFLSAQVEASVEALRTMVDQLKDRMKSGVVLLGSTKDGRVMLIGGVTQDLVKRGLNASSLVKEAASIVGGSGGGRQGMAQAGGKDCDKLPDALHFVRQWLESAVVSP